MSKRERKYLVGPKFVNFLLFIIVSQDNHDYVMRNNKPTHWTWLSNMSIGQLMMEVRNGSIRRAIINPEWCNTKKVEV